MKKNTFEYPVNIDMDDLTDFITQSLNDDAKYKLLSNIAMGVESVATLEKFKKKLNYIIVELMPYE